MHLDVRFKFASERAGSVMLNDDVAPPNESSTLPPRAWMRSCAGASGYVFCGGDIALPSAMLNATSTVVTPPGTLPRRGKASCRFVSDHDSQKPTNSGRRSSRLPPRAARRCRPAGSRSRLQAAERASSQRRRRRSEAGVTHASTPKRSDRAVAASTGRLPASANTLGTPHDRAGAAPNVRGFDRDVEPRRRARSALRRSRPALARRPSRCRAPWR